MSIAGRRAPQRPDEHVLVSGTTLRFAVLVVLILVSSAWMSLLPLAAGHTASGSTPIGGPSGCELAAGGDPGRIGGPVPQEDTSAYRTCIDKVSSPSDPSPWLSVVWPLLVVAVAAVLMWAIPAWKARRSRVVSLETVDPEGEIHTVLRQLATVAGLDRLPHVIVDPAAVSGSAVVFGSNRRPTICLHGGLLVRRHTDPERFRAVVLHEYAHIRNGDITLTYLTVALWRAFLGLVLLPYLAVLLTLTVWAALFFIGVRAPLDPEVMRGLGGNFPIVLVKLLATPAILAVLVHLSRADVLRTRETYADLAAVHWGADPRIWTGAAHLATSDSGSRRSHRALLTFREAWRTHPRDELRQESLSDPTPLYAARALPMFFTGVLPRSSTSNCRCTVRRSTSGGLATAHGPCRRCSSQALQGPHCGGRRSTPSSPGGDRTQGHGPGCGSGQAWPPVNWPGTGRGWTHCFPPLPRPCCYWSAQARSSAGGPPSAPVCGPERGREPPSAPC